ncbi:pirin family protein [Euhalothece natronophila Z-M001]|uniref:Pirin family protein n=1 Tax=Euhalothece natronophila Z-M001 TaxID=522448 RepID=A0A5B8NJ95_9CHRO|nr:pirin family protein [Euhalothece natronophila]QDZ39353.1 pirin family protein [Euhalothece natronophila Z-M001]
MITLRKANERGHANHGWLDSYHTFSFANYYDPNFLGFRSLRVINEDTVQPDAGFPTHGHRDMEILTYVLEGELEHKDNMGNGSIIYPGEVQKMSAGTGILHSEFNPSKTQPVHLFQIWILPDKNGVKPNYEQRYFDIEKNQGNLTLIAAKNGEGDCISVEQDVRLYASKLGVDAVLNYELERDRHAWLQVVKGSVTLNDQQLNPSDAAAVSEEKTLKIRATKDAEILLFDLA